MWHETCGRYQGMHHRIIVLVCNRRCIAALVPAKIEAMLGWAMAIAMI